MLASPPAVRRLSPQAILLAAAVLVLADTGLEQIQAGFLAAGFLDETAHLMTTLLVLWALGHGAFARYLWPALVASVLIDLDHIPGQLGARWLTAGTPRPYTHSLLTVVAVAILAFLWPRRRGVLAGVGLGLVIHFWRDLSEPGTGVALLWPWSDRAWSLPHTAYLTIMGVVVLVGLGRALRDRRGDREIAGPRGGAAGALAAHGDRSQPPRRPVADRPHGARL